MTKLLGGVVIGFVLGIAGMHIVLINNPTQAPEWNPVATFGQEALDDATACLENGENARIIGVYDPATVRIIEGRCYPEWEVEEE